MSQVVADIVGRAAVLACCSRPEASEGAQCPMHPHGGYGLGRRARAAGHPELNR